MPPRRSCFPYVAVMELRPRLCFNATTAFLLPVGINKEIAPVMGRFNATTAFLLPLSEDGSDRRGVGGFNATTAFLLHLDLRGVPAIWNSFNATTAFLLRWTPWGR